MSWSSVMSASVGRSCRRRSCRPRGGERGAQRRLASFVVFACGARSYAEHGGGFVERESLVREKLEDLALAGRDLAQPAAHADPIALGTDFLAGRRGEWVGHDPAGYDPAVGVST